PATYAGGASAAIRPLSPGLGPTPLTVCVAVPHPACLNTPSKASFRATDSASPGVTANHAFRTGPLSPERTRSIAARSASLSERPGRAALRAAGAVVLVVVTAALRPSRSDASHATTAASASTAYAGLRLG